MHTRVVMLWMVLLALLVLRADPVRADGALDVAAGALDVAAELRAVALGTRVALLEDPRGVLGIDQVAQLESRHFHHSARETIEYGFSKSVYWVRLPVDNSSNQQRTWLLEVAYPHLDELTLYLPRRDGGFEARTTGDHYPFRERDLAYRNFVFMLEQPAQSSQTYYLRVATSGSLTIPILAWTIEQFVEHQHLDWAGLCIFYGVILVMTAYNACLYLFTRQVEYLKFTLNVLAMGLFQMAYVGHAFQFLLPNQPGMAQAMIPLSVGLSLLSAALLGQHQLFLGPHVPLAARRLMTGIIYTCAALTVLGVLAPFAFALRLLAASTVVINIISIAFGLKYVRVTSTTVRLYLAGWGCAFAGGMILALKGLHLLPTNLFTDWSAQIGTTLQFVLFATAMAGRLNGMRAELGHLNEQLADKVSALQDAVDRAEQASALAERATRVKDEFIATMSHELRTPLNTIINIPQGLVEDFPVSVRARCRACNSEFELEEGDTLAVSTACPECASVGALYRRDTVRYTGQPLKTVRYLEKIERSGSHLLHVVEGMLRTDQTHLAEVPLAPEPSDMAALVRDVVEEMSDLSERAGVTLSLGATPARVELTCDPLRIRQVLINLIGNAIKFSGGRGQVRVSVSADQTGCVCSVQDQGIGIAPELLEKVFDSYRQADAAVARRYGGTGLGLAIARSLVRRHGGELWAESTLGEGATFHFRLPRARRLQRSASPGDAARAAAVSA